MLPLAGGQGKTEKKTNNYKCMTVTVNFTYDQMFDMVMQLTYADRMRMSNDIIKQSRMEAFSKIALSERPDELDDAVILAECKAARQEIYNQTIATR